MELLIRILPDDEKKWFPAECDHCGWFGSSELLAGGGPIGDTGDYDDAYCPYCGSRDIDETDNLIPLTSLVERLYKATDLIKKLSDKVESCDCSKHVYGHLEKENDRLHKELQKLTNSEQNVQVSDTTGDDSSTGDGQQK